MLNKMLIDASHPEETRVVVLRGNRVEEFDFESASKKQLRGNIYLAKVTRVEPSLQAAFVDYGGNRHGFLAFSEIHPDYYQIPVADRQALLEEEARASHDDEDEERGSGGRRSRRRRPPTPERAELRSVSADDTISEPTAESEPSAEAAQGSGNEADDPSATSVREDAAPASASEDAIESGRALSDNDRFGPAPGRDSLDTREGAEAIGQEPGEDDEDSPRSREEIAVLGGGSENAHGGLNGNGRNDLADGPDLDQRRGPGPENVGGTEDEDSAVEQVGGDAMEDIPVRLPRGKRHYKIQEVIKRRQVLLVQVVKEERGTKGAALTTYLSLAGRYSVLMPNTARGGGISRKITNALDRKRLKSIAQELEVPDGMGVILRTAGASRTKAEVKRDFEYLLRMWETVRELTLKSSAPTLVYEEGSLIKRAIRDLYNKDIDEVLVAGDEGYREAKEFMRMLMPSHAKNVQPYRDPQPIFAKAGAEAQLDAMFSNQVTLKSGGYIVINQTEALVAIDVNSGRSTREHNIEDTALRTNLEAADEVARQLRLRDLAGLIVVDFIDMEENRNNRAVERRIKDALKNDRARIQIGRISHFGLLEMSRQRMRTGVLEGSTVICPHCAGAGMVRSTSSIALHVLRLLEDALIKSATHNMTVRTRTEVALYILNQKRPHLNELEKRFGVTVTVAADPTLAGANYHTLERGELASLLPDLRPKSEPVQIETAVPSQEEAALDGAVGDESDEAVETGHEGQLREERSGQAGQPGSPSGDRADADGDGARRRRRRRRRRGRGGERDNGPFLSPNAPQPSDAGLAAIAVIGGDMTGQESAESSLPGRAESHQENEGATGDAGVSGESDAGAAEPAATTQGKRRSRRGPRRNRRGEMVAEPGSADGNVSVNADAAAEEVERPGARPLPRRTRRTPRERPTEHVGTGEVGAPGAANEIAGDNGQGKSAQAAERLEQANPPHELPSMRAPTLFEPDLPSASGARQAGRDETGPTETGDSTRQAETARIEEAGAANPAKPSAQSDPNGPRAEPAPAEPPRPKRSGWWQRAKATLTGE